MRGLKKGLLYLSLHNQLIKRIGVGRTVTRKTLFSIVGKHFLIHKNLQPVILKELQERKLVKRIDRDHIKILRPDINIETDINKLYKIAGVF